MTKRKEFKLLMAMGINRNVARLMQNECIDDPLLVKLVCMSLHYRITNYTATNWGFLFRLKEKRPTPFVFKANIAASDSCNNVILADPGFRCTGEEAQ